MITHGTIINKNGNISKVKIGSKEGCNSCGRCGKYRDKIVSAVDDTEAVVGDDVRVEISDEKYRQSVIILYIVPLLAFIVGVILGYYGLSNGLSTNLVDIVSVICGIICLSVAYLIIWLFKSRIDKKQIARIIAIIH